MNNDAPDPMVDVAITGTTDKLLPSSTELISNQSYLQASANGLAIMEFVKPGGWKTMPGCSEET